MYCTCMYVCNNLQGVRTLRTQDTSDPRQFGTISLVPKCLTFCVGTEVSLGHFGTGAELSQHFMKGPKCPTDISALVPKCLRQIGDALFLYRFTTSRHICTIHRDLLTASQDILYVRNHTRTFTFDSELISIIFHFPHASCNNIT